MNDKPMHGPDNKGPDSRGPEMKRGKHGPDDGNDMRGPGHKGPEGRGNDGMGPDKQPGLPANPEKIKQMEEMREKVLEFAKEFHPEKVKDLRKLHQDNPEEFRNEMRELRQEMEKMEKLEKENPERFKALVHRKDLRARCAELSKAYRETNEPGRKAEIRKELRPAIAELFDMREKTKERDVKEMEENVKKAVEIQKERQQNRDAIIDDHMREILGEPDPMKW